MTTDIKRGWQCHYCENFSTIREHDIFKKREKIINYPDGDLFYIFTAITCPNSNCRKLSINLKIEDDTPNPVSPYPAIESSATDRGTPQWKVDKYEKEMNREKINFSWSLLPDSCAKKFPDYIPLAIRQDYEEACKIRDLSPKASATLSRRCLQTIIRDFWEIKNENRLYDEINALSNNSDVSAELKKAFHNLREIGNIGAHMKKDINLIIDIEPSEAEQLIKFIECLIGLTYIEKHQRDELLKRVEGIRNDKKI